MGDDELHNQQIQWNFNGGNGLLPIVCGRCLCRIRVNCQCSSVMP